MIKWILVNRTPRFRYYETNDLVLFTWNSLDVLLKACITNGAGKILDVKVSYPGIHKVIYDQIISFSSVKFEKNFPEELREGVLK